MATAAAFVLAFLNLESGIWNLESFATLVFICFLIVIAVFDFKHYLVLDKVIYPAFILAIVYSIYQGRFFSSVIGAAIVAGFFLLQYIASRGRWIGFGDVKFGLFLGSLFGFPLSLILLMLAYCSGAIIGLALIAMNRKKLSSRLPFGAFLGFNAIIVLLYGQEILKWYMGLIGL